MTSHDHVNVDALALRLILAMLSADVDGYQTTLSEFMTCAHCAEEVITQLAGIAMHLAIHGPEGHQEGADHATRVAWALECAQRELQEVLDGRDL
jgi:hypothetical protein